MVRWGILGPGVAAAGLAAAMRAAGHDLAVVASRSLTRAQAFAASQGVRRARGSYADALSAEDVDAVVVALPNDAHERWAVAALEAGKHVLCPAPLAVDAAAAGRMAAAAGAARAVLAEALPARFHPRTEALMELVASGRLGELRSLAATSCARAGDPRSFRAAPASGGGALLDRGAAPVAMLRWLAGGEPDGVRAVQRHWSTGVDGHTAAVLAFPSGTLASLHLSLEAAPYEMLEVVGSEQVARLPAPFTPPAGEELPILLDGKVDSTWRADAWRATVEAFAEAVEGGQSAPPVDDAVATAQVLDRIRTAAL